MKTDLFHWLLSGAWGRSRWGIAMLPWKVMKPWHLGSLEAVLGPIFLSPSLAKGVLLGPKNSFPGQGVAPSPSAASSGRALASVGTLRTCKQGRVAGWG